MSEGMSDGRLKALEGFAQKYDKRSLDEACQEIRRLRAERVKLV